MKVLLGLSGGVDSAISAYLLKKAGYEVTGAFMVNAHSFPAQESIDRIAPYTDRVYCTTLGSSGSDTSTYHVPMNGSIRVHYDAFSNESLSFTNNDAKLKDTAWFKANRTCPSVWSS